MIRRPASLAQRVIEFFTLAVLASVLVACAPDAGPETPASSSPTEPDTSTAPAPAPTLIPDGTAAENLPVFTAVTEQVWSSEQRGSGPAYIDALVAAGFDRTQMQVTEDVTTVGNAVESMQFSVRWGEEACLVGQVGPSTGTPVTMVLALLAEGRCLIGNTRPIDW